MNGEVQDFVERCVNQYPSMAGRVLEVGSRDICGSARRWFTKDGQQKEPTARFPEYIGIDIVPGALVDVIMNAHELRFDSSSFDVVISTSALEHDDQPFTTLNEIQRVLKPSGYFILTVPSWKGCPPHCEHDYWRFMPEGVRLLLKDFEIVEFDDTTSINDIMTLARKRA
jgi:SAM-dependent methyltransferase